MSAGWLWVSREQVFLARLPTVLMHTADGQVGYALPLVARIFTAGKDSVCLRSIWLSPSLSLPLLLEQLRVML